MKKILSKSSNFLLGLVLATLFLVSFKLVKAWVEPLQTPPNGNLGAIMTTNADTQLKAGAFGSSNTPGYGQTLMQQWGLSSSGTMYLEPAPGSDLALTDSWSNTGNLRVEFARAYMPIIYDRDNTAYYDDPHSTSRMNYVVSDNTYTYGNENTNDIYIRAAGKWASQLGNDNLGNHTATTFLNMNWNDIANVNTETVSKSVIGGGSSSNWATVNAPTFNAGSSIYSYGTICAGNSSGACNSSNGVVISAGAQSGTPAVSINASGSSYFNAGNLGIGTVSPAAKLDVNGSVALTGKNAFNSYDTWLRINENGAFGSGIYTGASTLRTDGALQVGGGGSVFSASSGGICINGDCRTAWPSGLQLNTWQGNHYSGSDGAEYATVFYDTNNSGYYVDPNQASQMGAVFADNWFRPQGDTGLYFQSHGGGLNMTDNTWIRTYGVGNFYAYGESQATTVRANSSLCIGSDCRSAWPSTIDPSVIVYGSNQFKTSNLGNSISPQASSGFYESSSAADGPVGASWTHYLITTHSGSNPGNGYQMQIAQPYWEDNLYARRVNADNKAPWRKILDSGNYSSYALPIGGGTLTGNLNMNNNNIFNGYQVQRRYGFNGAEYDTNDAAYYVDPAGGSRFNGGVFNSITTQNLIVGGALTQVCPCGTCWVSVDASTNCMDSGALKMCTPGGFILTSGGRDLCAGGGGG